MADCVFCGIVAGSVPAFMVASEEAGLAFLDLRPVFPGHTLVIPRPHIETLTDLPQEFISGYFGLVQRVAVAVEQGMAGDGTFVAMNNKVSQSVPHLHTHVVPRRRKDGLRGFFWPRTKYESDLVATETAERIKAAFTAL
ncbi:HIT family protein [Rugosimonospora acidiphila]|uniref:HIT family protein n=1 Tax=Rugosimonospora acidiphila TaxID=556531 RepID=A0ABP9SGC8_9ACTN